MTATAFANRRELAHRTSDGIEISLLWSKASGQVTIAAFDTRSGEVLEFEVAGSAALDAFKHPYAYAATPHAHNLIASSVLSGPKTPATDR